MTTAEHLNAITDRAKFERIASDILRERNPELRDLIESGLNKKGESRKSLVDAFVQVKKNLYGYIEYTTQDKLEQKWLTENPENPARDGDLIKALRIARQKRTDNPKCKCQIFLVTNQEVSLELENKVQGNVKEDYISVKTIELSILSNFLDKNPIGQYLRWIHLQLRAEMLSRPLLKEICGTNLSRYSQSISTPESSLVYTSAIRDFEKQLETMTAKLALLMAPPGGGKSAAAFSYAMKAYHAGEIVLRIEPHIIAASTGWVDAIVRQLSRDYEDLFILHGSGLELFSGPVCIVVDDINNSDPAGQLEKMISWMQEFEWKHWKIICPVWPKNIGLIKNTIAKNTLYHAVELGTINRNEGAEFIKQQLSKQAITSTDSQIIEILNVTRQDPLLLTLYLKLIIDNKAYVPNHSQRIIDWYVTENINDLSGKTGLTPNRYGDILHRLGLFMLEKRNLHPTYTLLKKHFVDTGGDFDTLEKLAVDRGLFHFTADNTIVFRHDRVRDFLLIRTLQNLVIDPVTNKSIIEDPYYSQWTGNAISLQDLSETLIDQLLTINPLAVYYSLKFLQEDDQQHYFDRITGKIKQWNEQIATSNIPQEKIRSIAFALLTFDTKNIIDITKKFPVTRELFLARFRNGDTRGGVLFFASQTWFPPTSTNYWGNVVLDHVLQLRYEQTVKDVEDLLQLKLNEKARPNTYLLAGYLHDPGLLPSLQRHWRNNQLENDLHFYLWAVINCFNKEHLAVLTEALTYWAELKVDPNRKYQSRGIKNEVAHELSGIRWELKEEQIQELAHLSGNASYAKIIFRVLAFLDSPSALGAIITQMAKKSANEEDDLVHEFDLERWDVRKGRSKLSESSRTFLFNLWKNKINPDKERYYAFRFWSGNEQNDIVLKAAQSVRKKDTALYNLSIEVRRKLKDATVVPEYLKLIKNDYNELLHIEDMWNEEVKKFIKLFFKKAIKEKKSIRLEIVIEILRKINQQDAEEILVEFWDTLKGLGNGIIIALLIATPRTKELAATEINRLGFGYWDRVKDYYQGPLRNHYIFPDAPWDLTDEEKRNAHFMANAFRHIHFLFGNLVDPGNPKLSMERLESLQPYFELMEDHSLSELARQCRQFKYMDWVQKIALHLSKESRKRYLPTHEDIVDELRQIEVSKQQIDLDQYLEKLSSRSIDRSELAVCIEKFAQSANSFAGLIIICKSLEIMGTRKQIPIIENYTVKEEQYLEQAEPLKANTIYKILRQSID